MKFEDTLMLGLIFEGRENFKYFVRGIRPDVTANRIEDFIPQVQPLLIPKIVAWQLEPYDEKLWRKKK